MSSLLFRKDSLETATNGVLGYASGYKVTAYKRGAIVSAATDANTVSVEPGHSFVTGDKFIKISAAGGTIDEGTYRSLHASTDPTATLITLAVGTTLSVAVGDVLINLGADTGSPTPSYNGSPFTTYDDYAGSTATTSATVTSDSSGNYEYWTDAGVIWELIRDSSDAPIGHNKDIYLSGSPLNKDEFHVNAYGADPTGSRDSSTEVQAAIDAADTNGGGFVWFGAGTYKCNVILRGEGIHLRGILGAVPGGTVLKPNADSPIITFNASDSVVRSSIKGIAFNGTDDQATFTSQDGIQMIPGSTDFHDEIILQDLRFDDMGRYGIYALGTSGSGPFVQKLSMDNCVFVGCSSEGLRLEGSVLETRIDSCKWNHNGDSDQDGTGEDMQINLAAYTGDTTKVPLRVTFRNCTINKTQEDGAGGSPVYACHISGKEILFLNCDFEQNDREVLIDGLNVTRSVGFIGCNFDTGQVGPGPDSTAAVVRIDHCEGFYFIGNSIGGSTGNRKYIIDDSNGTAGSVEAVDIGAGNTWGAVPGTAALSEPTSTSQQVTLDSGGDLVLTSYAPVQVVTVRGAGGVSDTLDSIQDKNGAETSLIDGQIVLIRHEMSGQTITIADTDNIALVNDFDAAMTEGLFFMACWNSVTGKWVELSRSGVAIA